MTRPVLALALLCSCVVGPPPQPASPPASPALHDGLTARPEGALRAVTFNVARFFDTTCDSGRCDAGDFEEIRSPDQLASRAEQVAGALRSLDATTLCLQEIESSAALDAIASRLGSFPAKVMTSAGGGGSMNVAVLSAGELVEVRHHRDRVLTRPDGSTTTFAREFPEVHLLVDGHPIVLFCAHFRSKSSDDPGRRLAEAQAAYQLVTEAAAANPRALVLLGGDLNDTPGSEPMLALESPGGLLRVASDLPPADQGTYGTRGSAQAIDHLLLATGANGTYLPGSARAVRDRGARGLAGSDHAALLADFAPAR